MDTHTQKFKIRLGLFVAGGLALFVFAIFLIGKQKNLFDPVFLLTTTFHNVSGLQVGNNVRFTGINVGIVDKIKIINDSTVQVDMLIKKDVQPFIKSDCSVAIGSEGLIGDRLLIITHGSVDAPLATEGQHLESAEPVETDAIMASLLVTAGNAEIISEQLAEIIFNINNGKGTIGKLIQDSTIAENLSQTMMHINTSSQSLEQNMEALKHNFLLRGYFTKQEKEAVKLLEQQQKEINKQKKADEKQDKRDQKQENEKLNEEDNK